MSALRRIGLTLFLLPICMSVSWAASPELIGTLHADHANVLLGIVQSDTVHSEFGCKSILPAGDQNGDGCADFWVPDIRRKAFLFHGSRTSLSNTPVVVLDSLSTFANSNLGDLSGDGYPDYSFTGIRDFVNFATRLDIYFGGPAMDNTVDLHFGINTGVLRATMQPWGNAERADFDADGQEELIAGSNDQIHALLYRLQPPGDSVHDLVFRFDHVVDSVRSTGTFGRGLAAGDFTGDGHPDLVLSLNPAELCYCKGELWLYRGGPAFDTTPEMRFTAPPAYDSLRGMHRFGKLLVNLGDVNGDGFDDLVAGYDSSDDLDSYIYFGGPAFDSLPDVTIPDTFERAAAAGDVNRDGYRDLVVGFPLTSSSSAYVYVYYGGPAMDGLPDIRIYARDLPGYKLRFGSAVAGLGDVNGDGIDDFAAGAVNEYDRGEVFVFSGTGVPVDVPYQYEPMLPSGLALHQNYPNPFNASTEIAFALPIRSEVTLQVFNIAGEQVATLLQRELAAGNYRVNWDGSSASGKPLASGVYVYRLEADGIALVRKMLLLK